MPKISQNPPALFALKLYCKTTFLQLKSMCAPAESPGPFAFVNRFFSIKILDEPQVQSPLPLPHFLESSLLPDLSTILLKICPLLTPEICIPGPPVSKTVVFETTIFWMP